MERLSRWVRNYGQSARSRWWASGNALGCGEQRVKVEGDTINEILRRMIIGGVMSRSSPTPSCAALPAAQLMVSN